MYTLILDDTRNTRQTHFAPIPREISSSISSTTRDVVDQHNVLKPDLDIWLFGTLCDSVHLDFFKSVNNI